MAAAELLNRNLSRKGASSARHRVLSKSKISGASLCSAKFLFVGCLGENLHHWPSVPSECGRVTYTSWMPLCAVNMIDVTPGRVQKLWGRVQSCCVLYDLWSSSYQSVFCIICLLCQHFCPCAVKLDIEIPKKLVVTCCHANTHEQKGALMSACKFMHAMQSSNSTNGEPLNTQTWRVSIRKGNFWCYWWNRVNHRITISNMVHM